MKLDIVVSFKSLIQNFEGALILGPVVDDVYTSELFAYKTGHNIYRWKINFMLINIGRRTIP